MVYLSPFFVVYLMAIFPGVNNNRSFVYTRYRFMFLDEPVRMLTLGLGIRRDDEVLNRTWELGVSGYKEGADYLVLPSFRVTWGLDLY